MEASEAREAFGRDLELALDRVAFARRLDLEPDDWQADLLRSEAPRVLLNCARQSGKSTVSAVLALHRGLYYPRSLVLILAPSERQAKETFGKVAGLYHNLHDAPAPQSDRKLGMILPNDSRIEALPGTEKTVRGFSGVDLLLVDEAARVSDDLYHAIRPFLAVSGGRLVLLSTPYGRRGVFFEEWAFGSGWERYEIPATECPRISKEFLTEERRTLPVRVFNQEYLCKFEATDQQIFSEELIQSLANDQVEELQL